MLAGYRDRPGRDPGGIVLYRFKTRDYERLTERGVRPLWLPGGRRLLYAEDSVGSLFVVDAASREVREIPLGLRGSFNNFNLTVSRDGRTVYLAEVEQEADLWLLDLE
jgi:hypothetical protein